MDRAFAAGFAAGASGLSRSEQPYKGHSAGFRRGMVNRWENGYDEGIRNARAKRESAEYRDKAEDQLLEADNAMAAGRWRDAEQAIGEARASLGWVESQFRLLANHESELKKLT